MAQKNERARTMRLEQEFHRRLPRLKTFDATPGEHHFAVWNDFEVGAFDCNASRPGNPKQSAGPGISFNKLGKPTSSSALDRSEVRIPFPGKH